VGAPLFVETKWSEGARIVTRRLARPALFIPLHHAGNEDIVAEVRAVPVLELLARRCAHGLKPLARKMA
jgi:hypothetical protein